MEDNGTQSNDVTAAMDVNNASSAWNASDVGMERLASIVFSSAGCVLTAYIIAALTVYGIQRKLWRCCNGPQALTKTSKRDTTIIHSLTLLTACSVCIYMLVDLPLFWGMEPPYCATYHRVKIVCTAVGLFTVYFTLWFRVYTVFYTNPMLRKSTSLLTRTLNKMTVVLLLVMAAANMIIFLTSPMYETTPFGCLKVQKKQDAKLKWGLLISTTLLFQGLLLFSLLYPLCLHQRKLKERGMRGKSIMPLVRRAAITAVVCMVSDTLNAIYALTNKQTGVYVRYVVYGINFIINLLALLASFTDWREKLFPCCLGNSTDHRRQSVATLKTKSARSSMV